MERHTRQNLMLTWCRMAPPFQTAMRKASMSWQGTQTRAGSLPCDSHAATVGVAGSSGPDRFTLTFLVAQDTSPRRRWHHEIRQKGMRL